ncbi:ATPase, T2SS/T4P/T4SS family [Caldisphaera sp.]|uniref:ATPase, T2SS/T4P/T4SS family n=1 Tax=Caldisphaera sp. TaxID=2060322 RepID=UPI003D1500F7
MAIKLNIFKRKKSEIEAKEPDFGEKPDYLDNYMKSVENPPQYISKPDSSMRKLREFNFIYPVGGGVFIHVLSVKGSDMGKYIVIEPPKPNNEILRLVDIALANKIHEEAPENAQERKKMLLKLIDEILEPTNKEIDYKTMMNSFYIEKIPVKREAINYLKYHIIRDKIGVGVLEPFLRDPFLEDISCSGVGPIYVVHKIFNRLASNLGFKSLDELDAFVLRLGEKIGKPITRARPIVDASLPDGSRLNIVFGSDVSLNGTNFTIRKFSQIPISVTQLIDWNTIDERVGAYTWMLLREGMSGFICGETASGKTTALNAIAAFIKPTNKIVTIEDTAEIQLPHSNWTRELARDTGKPETSVTLFDLLRAALRQRPDYIIVGEIRGAEGAIAFQAMQCIKEGKIILENEIKNIKDLFNFYKSKFGSEIIDGKEIVYVKNEEIKIPSYNNGKIVKAKLVAISRMPKEKLIRIELEDGNVFDVTKNHKFITNYGEIEANQIVNLLKNNKEVYVKRIKNFKTTKKQIKFKEATLNISNPLFWYLIGIILGSYVSYRKGKFILKTANKLEEFMTIDNLPIIPMRKSGRKYYYYELELFFVDWLLKNNFIEFDGKKIKIKIPNIDFNVAKLIISGFVFSTAISSIKNPIIINFEENEEILYAINTLKKLFYKEPKFYQRGKIANKLLKIFKNKISYEDLTNYRINSYSDVSIKFIKINEDKLNIYISKLWYSGYMFSLDLVKSKYRIIYEDNKEFVKIIKADYSIEDYTYDLMLEGAKYYIGFNNGYPIPLEDTGHPVMATFHAGDLTRLIQRLTGNPINIPKPYMDNLNFAWFQASTYSKTGLLVRRQTSLYELVGYDPNTDQVSAIPIFNWDPSTDKFLFSGKGSSYLLEEKIARMRGLSRKNYGLIYDELDLRAKYLRELVNKKVFDYYKVFKAITIAESIGIENALKELVSGRLNLND